MLKSITIEGFKSIKSEKIELGNINVLIGANGSGKSNFISAFRLLQQATGGKLQTYVGTHGGPDSLLHFGLKRTREIKFQLDFGEYSYTADFLPSSDGSLFFSSENAYGPTQHTSTYQVPLGRGHKESNLETEARKWKKEMGWDGISHKVLRYLSSWRVYHFHDTSESARVKQSSDVHDNAYLRADASNLASFLYLLRETQFEHYSRIVKDIRLAAPFFDDFQLRLDSFGKETVRLEWTEKGSEKIFGPDALSDGTLRFICLTTLLRQPKEMLPSTILVDEPELGLHPYAITLLAGMLQSISAVRQVIVSTQSVPLVNQFEAKDLIIVNKREAESKFERLVLSELEAWMGDYALGELWEKNVLGGRPSK